MKHKLFCILGRTATGKSTLSHIVAQELGLNVLVSYTTRPMRKGETDYSDHVFISSDDVKHYKNDIVAYTKIGEYEYFATKQQLLESDIYVIDPVGLYELILKSKDMDIDIIPIYITVPYLHRNQFVKKRKDDKEVYQKRADAEDKQFTDFEKSNMIAYRVLNDSSLDDAANKIKRIIHKEYEKG